MGNTHPPVGEVSASTHAASPLSGEQTLGPNTHTPIAYLASDVIICAGEDPTELANAFPSLPLSLPPYAYRCYRFWRSESLSVIWTGIGTGCLEPLLFEILTPRIVRRVCLVGSAGTIRASTHPAGTPCWIESAYSLGMSIDGWVGESALYPRWNSPLHAATPKASIVSTDFYYITSPAGLQRFAPRIPASFTERYQQRTKTCELIDMETAAFFFFCELFGGESLTEYVAVKGASNSVDDQAEQVTHSAEVVRRSLRAAIERWSLSAER